MQGRGEHKVKQDECVDELKPYDYNHNYNHFEAARLTPSVRVLQAAVEKEADEFTPKRLPKWLSMPEQRPPLDPTLTRYISGGTPLNAHPKN